jgi:hypothetical protein
MRLGLLIQAERRMLQNGWVAMRVNKGLQLNEVQNIMGNKGKRPNHNIFKIFPQVILMILGLRSRFSVRGFKEDNDAKVLEKL